LYWNRLARVRYTADGPSGAAPSNNGEADEDYREFTGARADSRTEKLKKKQPTIGSVEILIARFYSVNRLEIQSRGNSIYFIFGNRNE